MNAQQQAAQEALNDAYEHNPKYREVIDTVKTKSSEAREIEKGILGKAFSLSDDELEEIGGGGMSTTSS